MTFLWKKKSRVARISEQFVADLQSPSKRCRSMVVDTGFPVSLVDLVVKNKNRLRKPSSRRKPDNDDQDWEISNPVLTSPLPPHLVCPEACADLVEFETRGSGNSRGEEIELARNSEVVDIDKTGDDDDGKSSKKVAFVNVLKVLVVVVLGLSSWRFAVAVAMLAIMLLSLKLVGKWVVGSSVPCSDARMHCLGITKRVHNFFGMVRIFRNKSKERESFDVTEDVAERDVDRDNCNLTDENGDIDGAVSIDDELVVAADPSSAYGSLVFGIRTRKAESKRDECFDGVPEHEDHKRDIDVKPKSKFMKMIVPKKLKNPKTGKRNTVSCAALFDFEQMLKENRGKAEEDEAQVPTTRAVRKRRDDRKMNEDEITNLHKINE